MKKLTLLILFWFLTDLVPAQQGLNSLFGPGGTPHSSYDSFEGFTYPDGTDINTIGNSDLANLGCAFQRKYVSRSQAFGLYCDDSLEKYINGADFNGLNGGSGWNRQGYVSRNTAFPALTYDTLESYSNGAGFGGLNGGTNNGVSMTWTSAYVSH